MKLRLLAAGLILAATATADAQQCEGPTCPYRRFCAIAQADYPPGTHVVIECRWPYAAGRGYDDVVRLDCPGFGAAVVARWRPYDQTCSHPFTDRRR